MGISLFKSLFESPKPVQVLMLGLDAAGKTTVLYKLKLGDVVTTIPTIGFNLETLEYKSLKFNVWDIGGQHRVRALWKHYFQNTSGIIYVVDSNDTSRIGEAAEELQNLLQEDQLAKVPVLVFANKQDMPNAMDITDMTEKLGLSKCKDRKWLVQPTQAIRGDGLYEGLDWLSSAANN